MSAFDKPAKGLRLVVLGCGSLGSSILTGVIHRQDASATPVCTSFGATTRTPASLAKLRAAMATVHQTVDLALAPEGNVHLARGADVVVLGCPPSKADDILGLEGMAAALSATVLVSVVAGLSEGRIRETLGTAAAGVQIVRAMPNVAATIRQSTTVVAPSRFAEPQGLAVARQILGCIGPVVEVPGDQLDIYTTLCSSGPAYFAHFLQDMVQGAQAVDTRLAGDELLKLAAQTMKATAELVLTTPNLTAAALKQSVATPGGSTAAGLSVLDGQAVPDSTRAAIQASVDRLQEMARSAP